jgi:hypothetical protein
MNAADGTVFVAGSEDLFVDASLVYFAIHPFGVSGRKLRAGEQVENDGVIHFDYLNWRETRDQRDVANARFTAALINEAAGGWDFDAAEIAVDIGHAEVDAESRMEVVTGDDVGPGSVQECVAQRRKL